MSRTTNDRDRAARRRAVRLVTALLLALGMVSAAAAAPAQAVKPVKPPDTVIDSGPSDPSTSATATFTFHSTITPATFVCTLDGGAATACTSPVTYTGLTEHSHTFTVLATSNGVSDTSAATATWTVDLTAPTAPGNLTATTPSSTSVALSWTASADSGGSGLAGYTVLRDGTAIATLGPVTTYTDSSVAAGSTHTYGVRANDNAGNVSTLSTVSATTPTAPVPDTVIDTSPAATTNATGATFTFHSTVSGSTFTCALDAATPATCTTPKSYTGLAAGSHAFSVYATAGGVGDPSPATYTWTIDTQPPSVPTGLTATTTTTSAQLSWTASTDDQGVTGYDISRDGLPLASVGAVTTYTDSGLSTGTSYSYTVRAKDAAGNVSAFTSPVPATPSGSSDPHLTRAPYLTDLVGLNVMMNFATDRSASTASVRYGTVSGTTCTPDSSPISATRITIAVGSVFEYQWKANVKLPAGGTYCYRVYLGSTDLLGNNPSPTFQTQVPFGSTASYSFDVFGDWGQVDSTTFDNPIQANLMSQIAKSGARFAITTGDNGYPAGSQINYGDLQQVGADTSAIFGPSFWPVPGKSIPVFAAIGNHGLARSDAVHPQFANWPADNAVATSGGRYQTDTYPSVNGSAVANYPSAWYAFDAGEARFYVLDAAWADTNVGTASAYANEAASHWTASSAEYQWLQHDLATHQSVLKFVFFHYPMYSDQPSESSDTFLQGSASLQGLLNTYGVNIAFSGHAHIYQRSTNAKVIYYTTGGGGAQAQSTGTCSGTDKYAVGWSYTSNHGTACGTAPVPSAPAQVYHFLRVTVSGSTVTVTPTDSTGHTFDSQTYTFSSAPDTYIDSAPAAGTTSSTATFTFHASTTGATFTCQLDSGSATACTSPVTYTGLAQKAHSFSVYATVNRTKDSTPATATWTVDSTNPTTPGNFTASASSPFSVDMSWSASTDNTGVTGYDLYRDGLLYQSLGTVTTYTDTDVVGGATYSYVVQARDIAGNTSASAGPVSVTTPSPGAPIFADGFESGTLNAWTQKAGLVVEGTTVHAGTAAVEGSTTNGATYAKKTLSSTYSDAYARVWFDVLSQTSQVNLLRLRDGSGASLGYVYIETTGELGFHDDTTGTNTLSSIIPSPGWHALELRMQVGATAGALGTVQVWLDNTIVPALSSSAIDIGSSPVGGLQIGEVQTGLTYDVAFDDVAFGTSRLGPPADSSPPTTPGNVTASADSGFSVTVSWNASTDDVSVAGYDIFRDGAPVGSVGSALSWTDTSVVAGSSYSYTVQARDEAGNVSPMSAAASVTTPSAGTPVFVDGFESGDLTAWTSKAGLSIDAVDVRSGGYAAEGSTTAGATWAKKTLPATYTDAYARVAFLVQSQSSQAILLRLRDTPTGNGGYLYLTATGKLAFRSDALTAGTTSTLSPGPGWHVLELHLGINTGTVETWLDGTAVPDLTLTGINLGSNPMNVLQIGDTTTTGSWDIVYDDAAFSTSRIGLGGDTTAPTTPGNVTATANSGFSVTVNWDPATDDVTVTGYDLYRDGTPLTSVDGNTTSYTDTTVLAGSTHSYTVRARDGSGNVSAQSAAATVTTPGASSPLFADGFERGDLTAWTTTGGLVPETTDVRYGTYAVEGSVAATAAYLRTGLGGTYSDVYARTSFLVKAQSSQVTLLRLRDTPSTSVGFVYLTTGAKLGFRSDALTTGTTTAAAIGSGWHSVELHLVVAGASSTVQVWLDGTLVPELSGSTTLGTSPVGYVQIGDTVSGTWDVVFDDVAVGTSRLGPTGDITAPSVPGNVAATADTPYAVHVSWDPATDDTAVTGYDVYRDGAKVASVTSTSYDDPSVAAGSTHTYAVAARDLAGNTSAASGTVSVTVPTAPAPVFADGFESGDLSAWTTSAGLTLTSAAGDVRTGTWAAEGNTTTGATYAKKTISTAGFTDAYARVGYELKSQAAQVNLLRLRDNSTGAASIGYVYLTSSGLLGFHADAANTNTNSAVVPGAGWHVVEVHATINGTSSTVSVWLDGSPVSALNLTTNLGTLPIGGFQIGDTTTGRTYDVVFDDAAFSTSRIGL